MQHITKNRFFLKFYFYITRCTKFVFIFLQVLVHGILHPHVMYNFLLGIVNEIAEFHKRCANKPLNFKESRLYSERIKNNLIFSKSDCFNSGLGNINPMESQFMASLVTIVQPKAIFELGTYDGFSTLHLSKNAPADSVVYTLDLPEGTSPVAMQHDLVEAHGDISHLKYNYTRLFSPDDSKCNIIELFGDSSTFDFSPYYGKIDLVFIDANHSYSYVKSDTENAFKMLSDKGIIMWHDYNFTHIGIFRLINEIAKTTKIYYVERTRFALFIKDEE